MAAPQRRRKDGELPNPVVAVDEAKATGETPQWAEPLAVEPGHEQIARRAYQLYEERVGQHGHDQDDWFRAERELRPDS